jgi:hypothetical protein
MELLSVAIIIGLVKAIKEYIPQVNGIVTVLLAIVLGGVFGYFNLEGLTILTGIYAGLGAVGVVTTAKAVGVK